MTIAAMPDGSNPDLHTPSMFSALQYPRPMDSAPTSPLLAAIPQLQAPKAKVNWLGVLADALAGAAGRQGPYATMLGQMRELQMYNAQQEAQFNREAALAREGAALKMYENPLAQTLLARGIQPGTPDWNKAMETQQGNILDPVVNTGLNGPVLRSQVVAAGSAKPAPTPAAIAALRANPALASDYDAQFGQGEAAKVLGGPTQPASGGFPNGPYPNIGPYPRY